jgi:Tfp pilus assembly protein PilO
MNEPPTKTKKFDEKRVFILVALTILILSVTVFRQVILNTVALIAQNIVRRERLAVLTKKATFLQEMDTNQLEKRVRDVEQIFPSKKPSLEFLNSMRLLSEEDSVTLGAFTLKPGQLEKEEETAAQTNTKKVVVENKLQDFQVQLEATGTLGNISKFVKDLERTAPLCKIENIDLSLKNYASESSILRIGLQVRIYYQAPPQTIPALETPISTLTQKEEKLLDELTAFKFYPLQPMPGVTLGKDNLFKKTL